MYFCCSGAIQNAAKHAGRCAQVKLGLQTSYLPIPHSLPQPPYIRVQALNGTLRLTTTRGRGTVLTISLPWPAAADRRR